ncbi:AAA family ATPase [Archaeoglobus sp.]
MKGPELTSKYFGESEERIRELFRKARKSAPSIIFFDEIDAIAKKRGEGHEASERIVAQLLTEMDGIEQLQDVLVIAATNRIDTIDTAILRPGRFDKLIYIPAPDRDAIKAILRVKTRKLPGISGMSEVEFNDFLETVTELIIREEKKKTVDIDEAIRFLKRLDVRDKEDIDDIINKMKVSEDKIIASKYIGADVEAIVKESAKLAMIEEIEHGNNRGVTLEHFKRAISVCPPSLPWKEYLVYESQRIKFKRGI